MSVCKSAGFLSPNRISEMVWDSESEEAGHRATASFIQAMEFFAFLDSRWNISVVGTLSLMK